MIYEAPGLSPTFSSLLDAAANDGRPPTTRYDGMQRRASHHTRIIVVTAAWWVQLESLAGDGLLVAAGQAC